MEDKPNAPPWVTRSWGQWSGRKTLEEKGSSCSQRRQGERSPRTFGTEMWGEKAFFFLKESGRIKVTSCSKWPEMNWNLNLKMCNIKWSDWTFLLIDLQIFIIAFGHFILFIVDVEDFIWNHNLPHFIHQTRIWAMISENRVWNKVLGN